MPDIIQSNSQPDCSALIDRAATSKERVRVSREGTEIAAVIPIEDLDLLEAMEDWFDLLEARDAIEEAMQTGGIIPWEQFEAELDSAE